MTLLCFHLILFLSLVLVTWVVVWLEDLTKVGSICGRAFFFLTVGLFLLLILVSARLGMARMLVLVFLHSESILVLVVVDN